MSTISVEDIKPVEEEAPPPREAARVIGLASGETLDRASASTLQRRRLSRTVGLIGPNNSGKTSLIASVYDLLQDGPVDGIGFAGSSTLIGFEKVCHDARAASRRGTPHMERTSVGAEATFFHLDLKPKDAEILSLFLGDRSGEDYLAAGDDIARAAEFFELVRADTVALLVNGDHLAGSEHRHEVKAVSPQIIGALIEGNAIRQGTRLAVVLTKNDVVLASSNAERVKREFDQIVSAIEEQTRDHLGEVRQFVVAASPKATSNVKRGAGVDELLRYWTESTNPPPATPVTAVESSRMIDLVESKEGAPV